MSTSIINSIHSVSQKKSMPKFGTGYTISVHQKISEGGKDRVQIFTGLVIKMNSGAGVDKTFTVRKVVDGIGVEKIFPIHSPNIAKIEVLKKAKIRRSKLYYIRERSGKSARFKETHLKDSDVEHVVFEEENAEAAHTEDTVVETAETATENEVATETPAETADVEMPATEDTTVEETAIKEATDAPEQAEEVAEATPEETTENKEEEK